MKDEITINLRALTEADRDKIEKVLDTRLNDCPDETNELALEILREFSVCGRSDKWRG